MPREIQSDRLLGANAIMARDCCTQWSICTCSTPRVNCTCRSARSGRISSLANGISKDDSTNSRRVVFSYLQNKEALKELFGPVAQKVGDRPGGYTRIIKLGFRQGDAAEKAFIELVDFDENMLKSPKAEKKTRRSRKSAAKAEAPAAEAAAPAVEEAPAAEAPAAEEAKAE